jgi:hypothetical protein
VFSNETRLAILEELERGQSARITGNEGRARVCARRAAGVALREYLQVSGQNLRFTQTASALELLRAVQEFELFPLTVKEAAQNLVMKVDENHHLPDRLDLLSDARLLIDELEKLV